jgi:uncharacterized membrane protein YqgA involved in biofilm formation
LTDFNVLSVFLEKIDHKIESLVCFGLSKLLVKKHPNLNKSNLADKIIVTIPWGAIINSLTIVIGAILGLFLGSLISDRVRVLVFQLFGLCLVAISLKMINQGNIILVLLSCVLGAITGELLKLSERLDHLGDTLKNIIKSKNPRFTEGLIESSVLVCVGAMSIIGSFEEGLGKGRTTVLTKTLIDFFSVMILASRLGSGVILASISVLVYQGALTTLASILHPYFSPGIEACLTGTGGVIVLGIAVNMIGLKPPISISSTLPALIWAIILGAIISS